MDLNKVQIIGNITQDLELKETPNGQKVVSFSVATNRNWTDANGMKQEQTEFHNCVLWGKLSEIATTYAGKGKKIYLEGRLQTRNWEAQDGTKRYRTEIVGDNLILLGAKTDPIPAGAESVSETAGDTNDTPAVKKSPKKQEEEISVEDLPF